jgi:hypothetical protein
MSNDWPIVDGSANAILRDYPQPLRALADLDVGAIVLRGVFQPDQCSALVRRFIEQDLMYDSATEFVSAKHLQAAVKEGGWGRIADPTHSMFGGSSPESKRRRIDIGTSLGTWGNDPLEFFSRAGETNQLFATVFEGLVNPIDVLYSRLGELAAAESKAVMTACEPDGRMYGPAIFRVHYGGYTYGPHFDSVRLREKRTGYAVHRFEHQFAGVMCIQNSVLEGRSAQGIIHRCRWSPEVDPYMQQERFAEYAMAHGIPNVSVSLEPGDLYFFNTQLIHEVPGVPGELPRIVLATFIGYSPDSAEVFVWS